MTDPNADQRAEIEAATATLNAAFNRLADAIELNGQDGTGHIPGGVAMRRDMGLAWLRKATRVLLAADARAAGEPTPMSEAESGYIERMGHGADRPVSPEATLRWIERQARCALGDDEFAVAADEMKVVLEDIRHRAFRVAYGF